MGSSENVPVPGDGPGAGQERQRGRAPRTRRWLRRRAKPLRRGVLLFIMVLVVEYLVVPELVGAVRIHSGRVQGAGPAVGLPGSTTDRRPRPLGTGPPSGWLWLNRSVPVAGRNRRYRV